MLTPKQEKFCQLYIELGDASAAYRGAYKADKMKAESVNVAACQLLASPKVSIRVSELKAEVQARHKLTVDDIIRELEEARQVALTTDTPQSSAAVAATMGKAKILGFDKQMIEHSGAINGLPKFVIASYNDESDSTN